MVKYPEEALRSWLMEASERRVFEDSDNLSLGGTEFEIEYVFSNEFRRVEDGFEADIQVRAIWLVDPRSKGMIADDDVDTLWRAWERISIFAGGTGTTSSRGCTCAIPREPQSLSP
jgi:hypothetical protein